jgi:hypothetical protein
VISLAGLKVHYGAIGSRRVFFGFDILYFLGNGVTQLQLFIATSLAGLKTHYMAISRHFKFGSSQFYILRDMLSRELTYLP